MSRLKYDENTWLNVGLRVVDTCAVCYTPLAFNLFVVREGEIETNLGIIQDRLTCPKCGSENIATLKTHIVTIPKEN